MENHNAQMLAEHLRDQARWRSDKADEYPDDIRNTRASDALTAAADEVEALPDDDPHLQRMDHALWFMDDLLHPGEYGGDVIRQYGFHHRGTVGDLLDDLAGAADRESEERIGDTVAEFLPDDTIIETLGE